MGQVTVTIADKVYRIACDDGQEDHLRGLAATVDGKIAEMRASFGEIGDNRLTVMAAITFLDDRQELLGRIARLEDEVAHLRARHDAVEASVDRTEAEIADAIIEAAERIDAVARRIAPAAQS